MATASNPNTPEGRNRRTPLVELHGVSRRFGGVQALADVDLSMGAGEVVALVGENGAGKSTLVKILAGVEQPDTGEIRVAGKPVRISDPMTGHRLGIAVVYQEPAAFPDLTVAEDIFAGWRPRSRFGLVSWSGMRRKANDLLADLEADFGADTPVGALGLADRQMLELAKALSMDARILILDEPTAALSTREVERLFGIVRRLTDRGVGVLFIGHRLEEVMEIADVVTVFRDGRHVATNRAADLSEAEIVRLMVGRSLDQLFPKETAAIGAPALELRGFTRRGVFVDVSFQVRQGEIVGLAGLVGAGRSEVARSLFGIDPHDWGDVRVGGRPFRPSSPRAAMRRGLVYVPEDRLSQGLVPGMSLAANTSMAVLPQLTPWGVLRPRRERKLARRYMEQLGIKATSPSQSVDFLSGGTQQKVLLAKWLAAKPRVLMLDEPTRGVDVGTKADVHRQISQLAADGLAVVLISSDLQEVLGMCDRTVVLSHGRVTAELLRSDSTSERIIEAASGLTRGREA